MADAPAQDTPTLAELRNVAFWRALAPNLSIEGDTPNAQTTPQQDYTRLDRRMQRDGYFGEVDEQFAVVAPVLRKAVEACVARGLPPVFTWVYDQTWTSYTRLAPVISHFLGAGYKALPHFWTWHVDPSRKETGWRPHRDKTVGALGPDGAPMSLTCWIPLTDANPLNSCMYVVPAYLDPGYNKPNPQPPSPFAVRALPAKPGDYLVWNQAVLHWGGASSEFGESPRMSMALEFQRGDIDAFNTPLLAPDRAPTFAERVRLVARQILQYRHMYGFSPALTELATQLQEAETSA